MSTMRADKSATSDLSWPEYDSALALKAFMEAQGLAMSKKFGQNFLTDRKVRERLAREVQAQQGDLLWEIGPGLGSMTALFLDAGLRVAAFEIDHGFARILTSLFGGNPSFSLIEGDFLRRWPGQLALQEQGAAHGGAPQRIFGNLPYNMASVIIGSLLEAEMIPERFVVTVQKEAAQRMAACPGSKDYSAFSVLCRSACEVLLLFDIGAYSFWPRPRVTSTVVLMTPRKNSIALGCRKEFSRFVRALFASRRKTIKNNLGSWQPGASLRIQCTDRNSMTRLLDEALKILGKPADVRAEALCPEELFLLFQILTKGLGGSVE